MEAKVREELSNRLIRIADMMESAADDPKFLKELKKEYKIISEQLYPKNKSNQFSAKEVRESKNTALLKIKEYLNTEDVEFQFDCRDGNYYSNDKFILIWVGNYKGVKVEYTLDKTDSFYSSYSGYKCIKAVRNMFLEKQLKGYHSFERALIEVGLSFLRGQEKQEFFDKYATAYNEKIKAKND